MKWSGVHSGFLAFIIMGALGFAACTSGDDVIPPLDRGYTPSSSPTPGYLEAIARVYYDCMVAAGLPVELVENHEGELAVVQFTGDHWLMVRSPEGGNVRWSDKYGSEDDPRVRAAAEEFFSMGSEPGLMIDGVDYSFVYARCLQKSGYDQKAAWGTTGMDSTMVSRQVDSNNLWAECARNNGWPMIENSVIPEATDGNDWPTVLIPVTITTDQLRHLLVSCPNFDPERQKYIDQWWHDNPGREYPADYVPDPSLDFYLPSRLDNPGSTEDPTPEEQMALDNLSSLYEVLYEKLNEYWAQQMTKEPIDSPS